MLKHLQSLFDLRRLDPDEPRHDRGIELGALHAGRGQQLPVSASELFDFSLDHAPGRFGERVRDIEHGLRQHPGATRAGDDAARAKISEEVHHEERASLRLVVDQRREGGRELVLWKLEGQELRHVVHGEEIECKLPTQAPSLKIQLELRKRMLADQELRLPYGDDHQ